MNESNAATESSWVDPDDEDIEWTEEMFRTAAHFVGGVMVRPATHKLGPGGKLIPITPEEQRSMAAVVGVVGRPKSASPKKQITIRLDSVLVDHFRATGPGWQTRINDTLRKAVGV